ncbi:hypothetical protein SK128_022031, partial [Halocaridina rubra]
LCRDFRVERNEQMSKGQGHSGQIPLLWKVLHEFTFSKQSNFQLHAKHSTLKWASLEA